MSSPPADVREAILTRLAAILLTASGGAHHFYRNTLRIQDERLPAIAMLDGDETPDDKAYGRGRPANTPVVVTMRPEIYLFVGADNPGPALNAKRLVVLQAVMNDATLLSLCVNGDIRFEGFSTGLAQGRSMEGEGAIALAFIYVLRPKAS